MHNSDEPAWSSPYAYQGQQRPVLPFLSPWSQTCDFSPPLPHPPPQSAPPTWSTPPANPHSHSYSWGAPSPYNSGQYNYNSTPSDAWAEHPKPLPWSSSTPARPENSTLGQPISPGYFGAGNQLPSFPNTSNPWNTLICSASEQAAASPYMAFSDKPGWQLSRSKSASADYKRSSTPSRTPIPSHRLPDIPNAKKLVKRPRDWRANYNPHASFLSAISGFKHHSDLPEFTDSTKRRLSSLIEYDPSRPSFSHDLRLNPLHPMSPIQYVNQGGFRNPLSTIELNQFVVTPSTNFLRVFHPRLPWYIDIHSNPDNITIGDILEETHIQLMQSILPRHYWNEALTDTDRNDIATAYNRRVMQFNGGGEKGILWIDFLCDKVIFQGFTRAKGSLLEMKTGKAYAS